RHSRSLISTVTPTTTIASLSLHDALPISKTIVGEARLYIDGQLCEAASGKTYPNINPANEKVLGMTADAGPEDMLRAIAAARKRSEEHTSELQSRENLVCRLLLEKKKTTR